MTVANRLDPQSSASTECSLIYGNWKSLAIVSAAGIDFSQGRGASRVIFFKHGRGQDRSLRGAALDGGPAGGST
jgi:hypothetical protein